MLCVCLPRISRWGAPVVPVALSRCGTPFQISSAFSGWSVGQREQKINVWYSSTQRSTLIAGMRHSLVQSSLWTKWRFRRLPAQCAVVVCHTHTCTRTRKRPPFTAQLQPSIGLLKRENYHTINTMWWFSAWKRDLFVHSGGFKSSHTKVYQGIQILPSTLHLMMLAELGQHMLSCSSVCVCLCVCTWETDKRKEKYKRSSRSRVVSSKSFLIILSSFLL